MHLSWTKTNFGLVSLKWRASSDELYPGFVPETQPPDPMMASQSKGYQICCGPRSICVSHVTLQQLKRRRMRQQPSGNSRGLTVLYACRHTQSPSFRPYSLRPLMSCLTVLHASAAETQVDGFFASIKIWQRKSWSQYRLEFRCPWLQVSLPA